MSKFSDILKGGLEGILNPIKDTIDEFHLSGEEKNKLLLEFKQNLATVFSQVEQTHRAELNAKEKIIVAELNQGDKFTKRARPAIVYWGILLITICYVIFPLITGLILTLQGELIVTLENGNKVINQLPTIKLPQEFWWAWSSVVGIYAIGRSAEKYGVRNKMVDAITGNNALFGGEK